MGKDRMPKKIFTQELEGTRRGRPRKRWKEEAKRDLQVLEVRRWREMVKNGRILFDRPKPTMGCSANGRRRKPSSNHLYKTQNQVDAVQTAHYITA